MAGIKPVLENDEWFHIGERKNKLRDDLGVPH
jgi:hypothetical protein